MPLFYLFDQQEKIKNWGLLILISNRAALFIHLSAGIEPLSTEPQIITAAQNTG